MTNDRLVSCLMVALPVRQRVAYFRKSVADYCRQTHPWRELVVVLDQGDAGARAEMVGHVASLARDDIRVVEPPGKLTLGGLRNLSVVEARGDVLCTWDDDDGHHPERVALELAELERSGARWVMLLDAMQYFAQERTLYWTNWHATGMRGFSGSLMFRRSAQIRYPESGPESERGEDTAAILGLHGGGGFRAIPDVPYLYVYVKHDSNTWSDAHHRGLVERLSISVARLRRREPQLRSGLAYFDFGPGEVTVRGYNGVAFTFPGTGGPSTLR
jgi:glycosyltransferase involved in cell wall biosynthesis